MRRVFYDNTLEEAFVRDGFVLIKNFIGAEQCQQMQTVFNTLNTGFEKGFHVTNWSKNTAYREASNKAVTGALLANAQKLVVNYKPVLGAFAVKYPGQESEMGIHQDWSVMDESTAHSLSFWCPLVDVNEGNGVMQFYKGSHKIYTAIRGKDIPFAFKAEQQDIIDKHLVTVPVNAGDAIVLHHRVVHRSLPNLSAEPRIVAMLAMIPKELPVKEYYLQSGAVKFNIRPDDFYVHYEVDSY